MLSWIVRKQIEAARARRSDADELDPERIKQVVYEALDKGKLETIPTPSTRPLVSNLRYLQLAFNEDWAQARRILPSIPRSDRILVEAGTPYIKREGLVEPIVVRPKGKSYEILGGFHRWKIGKELGYETVPCAVVELDDRRAKILSINLNEMKGQSVSALLSELVHDLSQELTLEDLESQLPYSEAELKDALELMKIPDGLEAYLDAEVEKAE